MRTYHTILGSKNGSPKVAAPGSPSGALGIKKAPAVAGQLRDIAAGGATASRKPTSVRLTPEQETDFQEWFDEGGKKGTREQYYTKWKARADTAKTNKKPIPKTLRSM